jgi:hypothetical protein
MENPYCNSVVFVKGIPISLNASGTTDRTGYILNSSSCGKAASVRIPRSIDDYVTGVIERSQRIRSSQYDE